MFYVQKEFHEEFESQSFPPSRLRSFRHSVVPDEKRPTCMRISLVIFKLSFHSLVQGHADVRGRCAHLGGIRIRVRIELVIARRRSKEHGHRRRLSVGRPFHFELFHQRDDLCIGLDKPLTGPPVDRRQAHCKVNLLK